MPRRIIPGLVTGTSSEYVGDRPLRRIFRSRSVVIVFGPPGSGKTAVAERIARHHDDEVLRVPRGALSAAVVDAVRQGAWPDTYRHTEALVLDGPARLPARPGPRSLLTGLLLERSEAGLHTVVVDCCGDGSGEAILADLPAGIAAVLALRFPASRSGRMRFARRICDQVGLPRTEARGTVQIEPWSYRAVIDALTFRKRRLDEQAD